MSDTIIERALACVRISNAPSGIKAEVEDLVGAALDDLERQGVNARILCPIDAPASKAKPLVVRAVCFYVRAHFGVGNTDDKSRNQAAYDALSGAMSMSKDYMKEGIAE